jgi:hypothetical protein
MAKRGNLDHWINEVFARLELLASFNQNVDHVVASLELYNSKLLVLILFVDSRHLDFFYFTQFVF